MNKINDNKDVLERLYVEIKEILKEKECLGVTLLKQMQLTKLKHHLLLKKMVKSIYAIN